jgi:hypothetical protein
MLGTDGLYDRCHAIDRKLDSMLGRLDHAPNDTRAMPRSEPDRQILPQAAPVSPQATDQPPQSPPDADLVTKMEAAATLLRHRVYQDLIGDPPQVLQPAVHGGGSRLCQQGDFATDAFRYWMGRLHIPPQMHRKFWEWFFIADVLGSRGLLRDGSRGLGFGVGREPLTALFAAHGCRITATDLATEDAQRSGWADSNQHAGARAALHHESICERDRFDTLVTFRAVDMNAIPSELAGFDFTWSACSLEHLGSLRHGMDFFINSLACLRPGGIAVHTTEFNISSNDDTFETREISLYRRRDIEQLIAELEQRGHRVEPMSWCLGRGFADRYVDLPPFDAPMHLRLKLAGYDCTSIGLIVHARG